MVPDFTANKNTRGHFAGLGLTIGGVSKRFTTLRRNPPYPANCTGADGIYVDGGTKITDLMQKVR
jgi:hypothetical protein